MEGSAEITKALETILDSHGYGFQYAVLATAERLFSPASAEDRAGGFRSPSFRSRSTRPLPRST